ncbi:YihY/virulence factor BrkB family protein [Salinarimonas chemoclinalis]|uniref:YihY/virulence factor BrkB family protein n=1 Tax=Salinarimonas chemoclinalis TaxID=3241599 RepID=UPI0035581E30
MDAPAPPPRRDAPPARIPTLGLVAATAIVASAAWLRRDSRARGPVELAGDDPRSVSARESRAGPRPSSPPDRPAERDPARGRLATTPHEIPRGGWIDIAQRVVTAFSRDRLMSVAAGVTFYALLALFPAIAAFVSLYGLVFSPEQVSRQVASLSGVIPSGAIDIVEGEVARVASQAGGALTLGFAGGLLLTLWSANAGMKAIFDALNVAYGEEEARGFLALNALTLLFTLGALVIGGGLVAAIAVLPAVLAAVPLGAEIETLLRWLRFPIALVLVAGLLALIFRYGPSRTRARWRWVLWGAGVGAVAFVGFSMLFTWYVSNFGSYNATYGSLGAVVGFMVWIWLSTTIVLLAAELNAEMERQTARDTTVAPERPLGRRGAQAADTVAPSP